MSFENHIRHEDEIDTECFAQIDRRKERKRLEQLEAALLPFAKAASDYEPPMSKLYHDEEHVALSLTAGHLRQARRVLLAKEAR